MKDKELRKLIGSRAKQRRLELGVNQPYIAEKMGVTASTIQRYEAGTIDNTKKLVLDGLSEALHVSVEWLKGETEEMTSDVTDKRELQIRDTMTSILSKLPYDMKADEADFSKDLLLLMLKEYELFVDSFQYACKNFKGNTEDATIAKVMGFESNQEYNEIMFLREITHTVNALNDMGDIVRLYSKNPETAAVRLANLLSEKDSEETDLFADETATDRDKVKPLSFEMYRKLIEQLGKRSGDAILPVQIAYFTGLRLGEVAGLTWQDINLEEQYLTVRRSIRYNGATHKHEIGPTKWKKIRVVDFGDTLADILRNAKKEQHKNRFQYGELYQRNFYREVMEKNRVHYEYYHLGMTENVPEDYTEIFFVCLREDGCLELPATIETACRTAGRKVPELEGFHFHTLRHTYTTNLLSNGAQPKDVQELLGHSDVSTTMNVYAHATREAKRTSARLLDKVAGND